MAFLFYFGPMAFININGKIANADTPALAADNSSYRYGDGLFETAKVSQGDLMLASLHFERLFSGLGLLKYELPAFFSAEKLQEEVLQLCKKNNCSKLARVRLSVYRGHGGLYVGDTKTGYIIGCWPLDENINQLNENGLVVDVYPDARKSCDAFASLKSASHLPYVMAALYAKENKLNDCLVLNEYGRIADSTIANVFIVKDGVIITPALSEGCIAGVMRKYLLEQLGKAGYKIKETQLTIQDIKEADEFFLTNAIRGIRWVGCFGQISYTNNITAEISLLVP